MKSSYGAKVLAAGVAAKAVVMSALVTLLAATAFWQSLVLVIVSAVATGIFALLVVLIQTHSERELHGRIDRLEQRTVTKVEKKIDEQTKTIVEHVSTANGEA